MIALMVAAAATLQLPQLRDVFHTADFPEWALLGERSAGAYMRILVNPAGRPVTCETIKTVGDNRLGKSICSVVRGKRLLPATLRDGSRVYALDEGYLTMAIPQTVQGQYVSERALIGPPDATFRVNRLPNGATEANVEIVVAYNIAGAAVDCGANGPGNPALVAAACQQRATFNGPPLHAPDGPAVPYVANRRVRFVVGP